MAWREPLDFDFTIDIGYVITGDVERPVWQRTYQDCLRGWSCASEDLVDSIELE